MIDYAVLHAHYKISHMNCTNRIALLALLVLAVVGFVGPVHRLHSTNASVPEPTEFVSPFLNALQEQLSNATSSPTLKKLISNCMLNTLKTTVIYNATDAFIITGDINAMWLRDSMNQLHPFVEFVKNDSKLDWLVRRIIVRQSIQIRTDPFANAFQYEVRSSMEHASDSSKRLLFGGVPFSAVFDASLVFERKFEIDSLASFLRLSNEYFIHSKSSSFVDIKWVETYETIIRVIDLMRKSFEEEDLDGDPAYTFSRESSQPYDTLSHERGNPVGSCGLIRSHFRPSDDATIFQYFIPGNCMMQAELQRSINLLKDVSLPGYDSRVKALLTKVTTLSE